MANQRSANKRKVNAWLEIPKHAALIKRAKDEGFATVTEFLAFVADENKSIILAREEAPAKKRARKPASESDSS